MLFIQQMEKIALQLSARKRGSLREVNGAQITSEAVHIPGMG